jgi:DtxR family Mn-dependent transcriptional regulator
MTFVGLINDIYQLLKNKQVRYYFMVYHNIVTEKFMAEHNIVEMSESEEMYLITIARLVERGVEEPVSITQLASEMSIQPVSANQMVHKLAEEELVEYLPYKGVQMTPKGRDAALQVLRDRRLWEVFLVEHLELSPLEADALACRLEHITPDGVTGRLAKFLGHPSVTPQGLPIPEVNGEEIIQQMRPLTDLAVGDRAEILRVEGDSATLAFLEREGLRPGLEVCLLAIGGEGALLLGIGENRIHMVEAIAGKIMITVQRNQDQQE